MAYTEVFAWGSDSSAQLGLNDSQRTQPLPRFCSFSLQITAVSCGDSHAALLDSQGKVYTIGSNANGRLGIGLTDIDFVGVPNLVDVAGETVTGVSCGALHTIAVTDRGNCYSWGDGAHGALGNGSTEATWTPAVVLLPGQVKARSASAGAKHSAFVCDAETRPGVVFTCGVGTEGQLGIGTRNIELRPVSVAVGEEVQQAACGRSQTVLLTASGKVMRTYEGGLATVSGLGKVEKVAAGKLSAALTREGSVYTWEANLGSPTLVVVPRTVVDISVGDGFAAVLDSAAQVWTWGGNSSGELGLGDYSSRPSPTPLQALRSRRVKFICCGKDFTLALGRDIRKTAPSPYSLNISEIVLSSTRTTPRNAVTSARGDDGKAGSARESKANDAIRLLAEEQSKRKSLETHLADRDSDLMLAEERLRAKDHALANAQRDIEELKTYLNQQNFKDISAMRDELDAKRRKMDSEIRQKETEIASLQSLLETSRIELAAKSLEIRQLSIEMESQTNELRQRTSNEENSKQELEISLRTITKQLKDSETALNSAKSDVKRLKTDMQIGRNSDFSAAKDFEIRTLKSEIAEFKSKTTDLTSEIDDLHQILTEKSHKIDSFQSIISSQTEKIAYFEGQIEVISKENFDLRERCSDLEVSLFDFRAHSEDSQGRNGDLLDQMNRLNRELRLTKETLRKAEEHNKHLLETIEKRSLTKAREYREKSLSVLKTPSPLRSRQKSPIPTLPNLSLLQSLDPGLVHQSSNENDYAKPSISEHFEKGSRLALREQDVNRVSETPPTFRDRDKQWEGEDLRVESITARSRNDLIFYELEAWKWNGDLKETDLR